MLYPRQQRRQGDRRRAGYGLPGTAIWTHARADGHCRVGYQSTCCLCALRQPGSIFIPSCSRGFDGSFGRKRKLRTPLPSVLPGRFFFWFVFLFCLFFCVLFFFLAGLPEIGKINLTLKTNLKSRGDHEENLPVTGIDSVNRQYVMPQGS